MSRSVSKSTPFRSVSSLLAFPVESRLSFGCSHLDDVFKGGVYTGGITEICGESASGKTQLCLQLCLSALRSAPNGDGTVVFVATEDPFPSKRLQQLVRFSPVASTTPHAARWTNNILVDHVGDFDQLIDGIRHKISHLAKTRNVRLVVIDSVAAIFRCYENRQIEDRWRHLSLLGRALHDLSGRHPGLCVICVNQVTSLVGDGGVGGRTPRELAPALGLTWANLVTTRFILSRLDRTVTLRDDGGENGNGKTWEASMRAIEVSFSPYLPNVRCDVVIDKTGFRGLP